jgi:hypothetical protein
MISCPGELSSFADSAGGYAVSCSVQWDVSSTFLTLDAASSLGSAVALLLATAFVFRLIFKLTLGGK